MDESNRWVILYSFHHRIERPNMLVNFMCELECIMICLVTWWNITSGCACESFWEELECKLIDTLTKIFILFIFVGTREKETMRILCPTLWANTFVLWICFYWFSSHQSQLEIYTIDYPILWRCNCQQLSDFHFAEGSQYLAINFLIACIHIYKLCMI